MKITFPTLHSHKLAEGSLEPRSLALDSGVLPTTDSIVLRPLGRQITIYDNNRISNAFSFTLTMTYIHNQNLSET